MAESTPRIEHKRSLLTGAPSIRVLNALVIMVAAVLSFVLLRTTDHATTTNNALHTATAQYVECSEAAYSFKAASDFLTSKARLFSVTSDINAVQDFYDEVNVTRRRDAAIVVLERNIEEGEANRFLNIALEESNALAEREGHAMRLVAEANGYEISGALEPLATYVLSDEELALSSQEQLSLAQELVFGKEYQAMKGSIDSNVELCTSQLIERTHSAQEQNAELLRSLLFRQRILILLLLTMVVLTIILVNVFILWPLSAYSTSIAEGQPLVESGSKELRLLAQEYNKLHEETRQYHDHLRHKADHDPLTGLFNRGAYDDLCQSYTKNVALMLVDVDYFKSVNDTYGHETGDEILKKVSNVLSHAFRTTDFPCRIGGDEFAVIITDISPQLKGVIEDKINQIVNRLHDTSDGLPKTTLSIGVAFSDSLEPGDTIFKAADRALYLVKERGRDGYAFAGECD